MIPERRSKCDGNPVAFLRYMGAKNDGAFRNLGLVTGRMGPGLVLPHYFITVTAPNTSNKWDFDYNAIGQTTKYNHPNGLDSVFSYDGGNRMTKIELKDTSTVVESFAYGLTDVGNITKITDGDGVNWNYTYDVNMRLASASRKNAATPTITASYTYTYDDAGNLVTKVQPFLDDFQDGNLTGWSASGSMSASGGYAANTTTTGWSKIYRSVTDADGEISFSYMLEAGGRAQVALRKATDSIQLLFWAGSAQMREWVSGGWGTTLDQDAAVDSTEDVWYDVRVQMDGANVQVWRAERGVENQQLVLETTAASVTTGSTVEFQIPTSAQNRYDNIQLRIGGLTSTQAYAYNTANELTSSAYEGVTTTYTYDDWGRMASKYTSNYSADYEYRYGGKLYKVTSTFPGEGTVTYDYGGNGKRREKIVLGGDYTWYNWDAGSTVISEEDEGIGVGDGTLTRTYVTSPTAGNNNNAPVADVDTTNPA
ncbi:MAG: hypothetical protein FVQ81_18505, partial [Candidatus Glassbacteria bacterium]|nr:hypothetical protein [Candidatus Glassbacteria bacterium]